MVEPATKCHRLYTTFEQEPRLATEASVVADSTPILTVVTSEPPEMATYRRQSQMENRDKLTLSEQQQRNLIELLKKHHVAFSLRERWNRPGPVWDQHWTTGEISRQLQKMQVCPWASPVALVRKKDGSHRFCVELNAVTRKDTFPLPRVDDLLDQLGSSLRLLANKVHPESQPKTAFVSQEGLHEFAVMQQVMMASWVYILTMCS